jgi:DNA-binding transcriptional LysR family regulator
LADDVHLLAFPELVSGVRAGAPHVVLTALETDHQSVWSQVRSGLVDIGVTVASPPPKGLAGKVLLTQRFVVVHRSDVAPPTTIADYLGRPHVAVGFSGGQPGYVDARLEELGRVRNVIAWTPRFGTIADLVIRTGAIATVPDPIARAFALRGGVSTAPCPFDLPDVPLRLAWHLRRQSDPLNSWARAHIERIVTKLMST